jgi:predicted RNase H-like HicB family nuclease
VSDPHVYVILIGPAPDGHFGAWAPDLPGRIALGDTVEATERETRKAIALHLDGLHEDGLSVPTPKTVSVTVRVTAA